MSAPSPQAAALPGVRRTPLESLGKTILGTLASNVSVFVLGLATSIIINRSLGPAAKGSYAMLLTSAQIIAVVTLLGLNKSVTYHLARPGADRVRCFRTIVTFSLLSLLAGGGTVIGLSRWLPEGALRELFRQNFWGITLLVAVSILTALGLGVLRGVKRFKDTNLLTPATSLTFLILLVACGLSGTIGVATALGCKIVAGGFILGFVIWRVSKQEVSFRPRLDSAMAKGLMAYGLGYFGYATFQTLNYRFDIFLVATFTDGSNTGYYSTAAALAEILWFFPNAIGMVLMPFVTGSKGESGDQLTARICRMTLPMMALGALGLAMGSRLIVGTLYGEAFLPSAPAIQALALGILSNGVYTVLGTHLASRNRLRPLMLITAFGFAVNFTLNVWWIPRWGIVGAGIASSVSYTLTAGLTALAFARLTGLRWRDFLVVRREEITGIATHARRKIHSIFESLKNRS